MSLKGLKRGQERADYNLKQIYNDRKEMYSIPFGQMKCVTWMKMVYPSQLGKCFIDEDEGYEDGEDFLGEAGDETHQEAALKGHNDHHDDDQPQANPHSPHNVLNVLRLAELKEGAMGTS